MIAAEFFLSAAGLGSLLITESEQFDTAGMLAVYPVITVIGVILMAVGRLIERHFARWRVRSMSAPGAAPRLARPGRWPARARGGPGAGGGRGRRALLAPVVAGIADLAAWQLAAAARRRPISPARSASWRRSRRC